LQRKGAAADLTEKVRNHPLFPDKGHQNFFVHQK